MKFPPGENMKFSPANQVVVCSPLESIYCFQKPPMGGVCFIENMKHNAPFRIDINIEGGDLLDGKRMSCLGSNIKWRIF